LTVSVEDKIELFRNMIFKDIEEFSSEKRNKAAESFEQEKSSFLKTVEVKRDSIIKEAEKKAYKEKQQLIAKAKSQLYHHQLEKRQQFINEITELLLEKARSFVSEDAYKEYLTRSFSRVAAAFEYSDSVELYFTKRDLETQKELIQRNVASLKLEGKCLLKESKYNIIGGFYAEDGKKEIQVDYTLKSLIEENRELIGSSIARRLDEVQGNG
jgi:vacuolar-type H+-ATPase subunit E/Vma4